MIDVSWKFQCSNSGDSTRKCVCSFVLLCLFGLMLLRSMVFGYVHDGSSCREDQ